MAQGDGPGRKGLSWGDSLTGKVPEDKQHIGKTQVRTQKRRCQSLTPGGGGWYCSRWALPQEPRGRAAD